MNPAFGMDCVGTVLFLLGRWGARLPDCSGDLDDVLIGWVEGSRVWQSVTDGSRKDGDVFESSGTHGHSAGVSVLVDHGTNRLVTSFPGKGVRAIPIRWLDGKIVGQYRWGGERVH